MAAVATRIPNRLDALPGVVAMVDIFGVEHALPAGVVNDLNLALDEALNNIIRHGYEAGAPDDGEIAIRVSLGQGEMVAEVEDAGRPFDPLAAPAPDLSRSARERVPGGLGILFIKTLMDEVAYERRAGRNRLRLCKKLATA